MFRDAKCTIERMVDIVVEGEVIDHIPEKIASDIPCHLSVESLSATNQTQSTATILLDYVLYTDTKLGLDIRGNDKIYVTTAQGQKYELKAGESHRYKLTTQTHCEVVDIV